MNLANKIDGNTGYCSIICYKTTKYGQNNTKLKCCRNEFVVENWTKKYIKSLYIHEYQHIVIDITQTGQVIIFVNLFMHYHE